MEVSDSYLIENRDWDPSYIRMLFADDFNDYSDLWSSSIGDNQLVRHVECTERYSPIVQDISLDDSELCQAVERIEEE